MQVLLIAGSPSLQSRSSALLDHVGQLLRDRQLSVDRLEVRALPAQALLQADLSDPAIKSASERVQAAHVLVIATPVYKAAYSGVVKAFLDLLPQQALHNKTVLPLATGGSPHHMLALDYALRPVLQSLAARQVLPGVYATEGQVSRLATGPALGPHQPDQHYQLAAEITQRLEEAVNHLLKESWMHISPRHEHPSPLPANTPSTMPTSTIPFSQVRCSV